MNHPLMETKQALATRADGGNARASGIIRFLPIAALSVAAAMLAGCGSSSSGPRRGGGNGGTDPGFERHAAQYADDEGSYADAAESGEDIELPMYQRGFDISGGQMADNDDEANFSLSSAGSRITIETSEGEPLVWDDVAVGNGFMSASATEGNPPQTFQDFESQYMEFAQFGYWVAERINLGGETEWHRGGVFHQGFETRPDDMPTGMTATYSGSTTGIGVHGGEEYLFDGTVNLTADFGATAGSGSVSGEIATDFNIFDVAANIDGNHFSGSVTVDSTLDASRGHSGGSGEVDGAFYGDSAQEAAGTWSHRDGNNAIFGGFGARED